MAEASPSIFNKTATEKLRSPDDLDKYVRVTNPSVWVVLAACIALVVGLFSWGVFGSVTSSLSDIGVVIEADEADEPIALGFLSVDDVAKVHEGDVANMAGAMLTVAMISETPLSKDEAKDILVSDYLVSSLMSEDWAYLVIFDGDISELSQDVPLAVNITVERLAPISLILKNWG